MPTDYPGLLKLAQDMMDQTELVHDRYSKRNWLYTAPGMPKLEAKDFLVQHWLDAMSDGLDLLSDKDSLMTKSSWSHKVWLSMGAWRLDETDPKIYLECRTDRLPGCFGGKAASKMDSVSA